MSDGYESAADYAAMLSQRGYVVLYRRQSGAQCPGCRGSNWTIGRTTAECAFCNLALPLAEPVNSETTITIDPERTP